MERALATFAAATIALLAAACETPPPTGDLTGEASVTLDPATQQARWRTPGNVPASSGVPADGIHTIRFVAVVGDAPFQCGSSYSGIGVTGSTILPLDLRLYLSEVTLIDEAGRTVPMRLVEDGRWQYRDVALLDFENGQGPCADGTVETRQTVTGAVPAGRYRGVEFSLGVPRPLNVGAPALAASPLNDPDLAWPAPGGFRFLKLDMATSGQPFGSYPPPSVPPYTAGAPFPVIPAYPTMPAAYGFPVHIGGAECTAYGPGPYAAPGCGFPNRVRIRLADFDIATNVVVIDLRALLATSNVDYNTPGTPAGCQSTAGDPDCAGVAGMLGLGMPGIVSRPQSVFRIGVQR